jgi:hypothetical protein
MRRLTWRITINFEGEVTQGRPIGAMRDIRDFVIPHVDQFAGKGELLAPDWFPRRQTDDCARTGRRQIRLSARTISDSAVFLSADDPPRPSLW